MSNSYKNQLLDNCCGSMYKRGKLDRTNSSPILTAYIILDNYFGISAYVITTGATLFVIMDLALLLGMFRVCKELVLTERLSSAMSPACWSIRCVGVTDAGWDPALAVVPIIRTELQSDHTLKDLSNIHLQGKIQRILRYYDFFKRYYDTTHP